MSFFHRVPADQAANLRWRLRMLRRAERDVDFQACMRQAAWDDPVFFFSAFMFAYEPRMEVKLQPFVPWKHQVRAIQAISDAIEESCKQAENVLDIIVDKSREQGATLIFVGEITRRFLKDSRFAGALMSRNMDLVDNPDDPDSLMSKLDQNLMLMPSWMLPESWNPKDDRLTSKHICTNRDISSTVVGWASTSDAGRGGRKTFVHFDEVAFFDSQRPGMTQDALDSTQANTNCRSQCSTHSTDSGPFFDAVTDDSWVEDGEILKGGSGVYRNPRGSYKIVLDWRDNPKHNKLLYRYSAGAFVAENREDAAALVEYVKRLRDSGDWSKLERRGFIVDGALRSPWYDNKCFQMGMTSRSMEREYNRNPRAAAGKIFPPLVMDDAAKKTRPPEWEGDAICSQGKLKMVERAEGKLKLWFVPGLGNAPPPGSYVAAADIAAGAEGDNSVLSVGNISTGEQVLEYVDSSIAPQRFAALCCAISEWLNRAFLLWEAQGGVGGSFTRTVMEECFYPNVYIESRSRTSKVGAKTGAGWANNATRSKYDLFNDLWVAMDDGEYVPRSADLIKECRGWEMEKGKIVYKGEAHGDRVIAAGLCYKGMKEKCFALDKNEEDIQNTENEFNMAGRLAARMRSESARHNDFSGFHGEISTFSRNW